MISHLFLGVLRRFKVFSHVVFHGDDDRDVCFGRLHRQSKVFIPIVSKVQTQKFVLVDGNMHMYTYQCNMCLR